MKYIFTLVVLVLFCEVGWTALPNIILNKSNDNRSIDNYTSANTYEVQDVDLSKGATFTIPVGHTLIVNGSLTVHQSYLYVYGTLELRGDVDATINIQTSSNNSGVIVDKDATVIFNGDGQVLDLKGGTNINFTNVVINDPGLEIKGTYTITGDVTLGPNITDPGSLNINFPPVCLIVDSNQAISNSTTRLVSCVNVDPGFTLLIESGSKLVVTGDITNNGTISGINGSLEVSGSANQTISGTGSIDIGTLIMSNSNSSSVLDIQQGMTVNQSVKLTRGVFTPNGNVTLKSTSPTNYAILKKVETDASIASGTAGYINFQKHFGSSSITKNGWWQLSPSLNSLALSQWSELDYSHIYCYNEPTGKWVKSTTLGNGLGQIVYLKASNFTSGSKLLQETGRPNTGDQIFNLTSDGSHDGTPGNIGWHFIANPYAAPLDWNSVSGWTKNNVIGSFYIWDAAAGDYTEIVSGVGNPVIAPGQGFWVKVNDINASALLTISEDAKSETRSSIFRKKEVDQLLTVEMKDPALNSDKMYVRLKEGATDEFDSEYDAYKMAGNHVVISSFTDAGTELSINTLPINLMQKKIKLKVTSKQKGTHQLNFNRSNLESQKILLKDKYLNKTVDLDQETIYQFEITNEIASVGTERFELIITQEVQFNINSNTVYSNNSARIPVTVSNFNNILAGQFSLSWDESLLTFAGVNSFGLSSIAEAHFNQPDPASLSFVWDQQDLIPQSLNDGDTLFVLEFEVTGTTDAITSIALPGAAISPEVIGDGLVTLASAFHSGEITIKTQKVIAGKVQDINYKPVMANILVNAQDQSVLTDATGNYQLQVASDQEVNLSVLDTDKGNKSGISTLDILLARRHLLAQEVITDPFMTSAADVDGSGNVSVLDIALIRQIILGYEDNAIKNKSWRYLSVDEQTETTVAGDPDQSYDFVAVKIGDLNSSWNTDHSRLMTSDLLQINSTLAPSGQQIEVPVTIKREQTLTGFQMTILYDADKLVLQEVISSDFQLNFHIVKAGQAIVQWDDQQATGLTYNSNDVLFNLVFDVNGEAGETASVIINSQLADAIIIDNHLNENLIASSFAELSITESVYADVKFSNYPNPVVDFTNIVFNANEAGQAKIILYNANGQQLESFIENTKSGYNIIEWKNQHYKTGTYILKLQMGQETYSTRMLIK